MGTLSDERLGAGLAQPLALDAEVLAVDPTDGFQIRTLMGERWARRALSCLLCPEVGDRVLVAETLGDEAFVIAVLDRPGDAPLHLALPGATRVTVADGGGLNLDLDGPLGLGSRTRITANSPEVGLNAERFTLVCRRLSLIAREALASLRNSRLIASLVDVTAERLDLRLDHSRRKVRDLDQVHAGNLELRAEQVLQLRSETLLAGATKLAKVDGEQIHLG